MKKITQIIIVTFIVGILLTSSLIAGEGSGDFKAGYIYVNSEGNKSVHTDLYNTYEGFAITLEDLNYQFDNGVNFNANLRNISLNNRNLFSSIYKPGCFDLSVYNNQYRRIYDFSGDNFTRRKSTTVKGSLNVFKNIKLYSSISRSDKQGESYEIFSPVADTSRYRTDYSHNSFNLGVIGSSSNSRLKAEYNRYDFYDDLNSDNDRKAEGFNFSLFTYIPNYRKVQLSGGYSFRQDEMYETTAELESNQYWAGTKVYFANQFKLNYRLLYGLAKNRGLSSYTDHWVNTVSVTKGFTRQGALTVGYESRIADDHFDRTEATGYIFSGWYRANEKIYFSGKVSLRNKEVKTGATILGDEDYSRHALTFKYTGDNWGDFTVKYENKIRKNDDINNEIKYNGITSILNFKLEDVAKIKFSYSYFLGKYTNHSDDVSFEFADNVLTGAIYPRAHGKLEFYGQATYYRSHRDNDVEKFNLVLVAQYLFPHEHKIEVKYNALTYDDLMISNNFYTGNIVEVNFIKGFNL